MPVPPGQVNLSRCLFALASSVLTSIVALLHVQDAHNSVFWLIRLHRNVTLVYTRTASRDATAVALSTKYANFLAAKEVASFLLTLYASRPPLNLAYNLNTRGKMCNE